MCGGGRRFRYIDIIGKLMIMINIDIEKFTSEFIMFVCVYIKFYHVNEKVKGRVRNIKRGDIDRLENGGRRVGEDKFEV